MRLMLAAVVALACVVSGAAPAAAQAGDPPVLCSAFRAEWQRLGANVSANAATDLLARVPRICSSLRGEIGARIASSSPSAPSRANEAVAQRAPGAALPADCAFCPELRYIPAGAYQMGDPGEASARPVHTVRIARAFAMTATEITVDTYSACINDGACAAPQNGLPANRTLPVTFVSHHEARQFATWLSRATGQRYRLPSEAEWEYAARSGRGGDHSCRAANIATCGSVARLAPAGQRAANAWGLYDTVGNVSEWTADCFNSGYSGAPADQSAWVTGPCTSRSLRGGSYFDGGVLATATGRDAQAPEVRGPTIGFRLVRELDG